MGKLKFPKEKEEILKRLEEAKRLISASPNDAQVLLEAFNIISDCAEKGSPRGWFLKACFLYVDEPNNGDYGSEIISALDKAAKGKYPLACGVKADYLFACGEMGLLYDLIRKCREDNPQVLYAEGGIVAGYCDVPKGVKQNLAKACECFEKSARLYAEYESAARQGKTELTDITVTFRNPYYFSEQAGYAYQMLMFVYADMNIKANVSKYIAAYENAQKYGNTVVRYKTAAARASDSMNNVMGMHSLKTVNAVLNTAKAAYSALDEEQRERLKEHYDALWNEYDEFYDYEMQRLEALGNMEVYTSPDYAKQDSLVSDLASAVSQSVQNWANTPTPKTEYTVTVDNKTFKLNDRGEMIDEYGQRNGLRVDTTSKRVYNEKSDAVGYFDSFGYFHKY